MSNQNKKDQLVMEVSRLRKENKKLSEDNANLCEEIKSKDIRISMFRVTEKQVNLMEMFCEKEREYGRSMERKYEDLKLDFKKRTVFMVAQSIVILLLLTAVVLL